AAQTPIGAYHVTFLDSRPPLCRNITRERICSVARACSRNIRNKSATGNPTGTRSTREEFARLASTSGLQPNVSLVPAGRHTRTGIRTEGGRSGVLCDLFQVCGASV